MLTQKQSDEIKGHLEMAQNPIFFFDNDQDGLCSFLLLQRFLGRGKGVAAKSFPDLTQEYFRKVKELGADYIFILDKPLVSNAFLEEAHKVNIPVVWIDHHKINKAAIPDFVNYYNPSFNKNQSSEPVTALCYEITKCKGKDDMWIAAVGCISDGFVPDFYGEYEKKYPDLAIKTRDAFEILYKSQTGKISRMLSFGLKDRTTNVVNMLRFLIKAKSPYEVLEDSQKNHAMHVRFEQIFSKFQRLLKKAVYIAKNSEKLVFFQYGGDLSISADISNEVSYMFPNKIVTVVYVKGAKANISMRGKEARNIILKAIEGLEHASAGGHEVAVGGQIGIDDLERFRENVEKHVSLITLVNKQRNV